MIEYLVILAAGKGTRLKASTSKPLVKINDKSLIEYVIDNAMQLVNRIYIVAGNHNMDELREYLGDGYIYCLQEEQLGTAHAFKCALDKIESDSGNVMLLYADTPLIKKETIKSIADIHLAQKNDITFLTAETNTWFPYASVLRNEKGDLIKINETYDSSKLKIKEYAIGVYVFGLRYAKKYSENLHLYGRKEFYIDQIINEAVKNGDRVGTYKIKDDVQIRGINTPEDLEFARMVLGKAIDSH